MNHTHPPGGADPQVVGQWELLEAEFAGSPTHTALLPTRRVFVYGGSSLDPESLDHPAPAEILDLETLEVRQLSMQGVDCDLWCGGHTFLPDGSFIFAGGTSCYPPVPDPFFGGLRQAFTFDPFNETWERLPDMSQGRWYPTLIRLEDNSVMAVSGLQFRDPTMLDKGNVLKALFHILFRMKEHLVDIQEIYNPESGQWESMAERRVFPLYPRLHLLPDGDVFYSGVFNTHYFTPGKFPSARWDHQTGAWNPLGGRHEDKNREEGISLLLALRPPDYRARVLIAGGGHHNLPRTAQSVFHSLGWHGIGEALSRFTTAMRSAEIIDLSDDGPRWKPIAPMNLARIHAAGVLLPNGQVLVVGGMPGHGHGDPRENVGYPVMPAELYDTETGAWSLMALPQRPRVYHSTALLLPDGRVLSMGGNPQAHVIEPSIEIFSPPYLFCGERPVILSAPEQLSYQSEFNLKVDRAHRVAQVVLMRPEVLTHVTNTDQRLVELDFTRTGEDTLEVQTPPGRAVFPQGYAMLFILSQDGAPSEAAFVRVA